MKHDVFAPNRCNLVETKVQCCQLKNQMGLVYCVCVFLCPRLCQFVCKCWHRCWPRIEPSSSAKIQCNLATQGVHRPSLASRNEQKVLLFSIAEQLYLGEEGGEKGMSGVILSELRYILRQARVCPTDPRPKVLAAYRAAAAESNTNPASTHPISGHASYL